MLFLRKAGRGWWEITSVGAFHVSHSITEACFIYFLFIFLSGKSLPTFPHNQLWQNTVQQSFCLFFLLLLIKTKKQQHRQSFHWLAYCYGGMEIFLLKRNTLNLLSWLPAHLLSPLPFPLCGTALFARIFFSHLPLSTESLREEEKVIKGKSSTLFPVSFIFLWPLFKKIITFFHI